MLLILLLWLLVLPQPSSAGIYACPSIDGDTYTETPSRSDCRLLEIQPPPLVFNLPNSGHGFNADVGLGPKDQRRVSLKFVRRIEIGSICVKNGMPMRMTFRLYR
jgi:hypothetical protein